MQSQALTPEQNPNPEGVSNQNLNPEGITTTSESTSQTKTLKPHSELTEMKDADQGNFKLQWSYERHSGGETHSVENEEKMHEIILDLNKRKQSRGSHHTAKYWGSNPTLGIGLVESWAPREYQEDRIKVGRLNVKVNDDQALEILTNTVAQLQQKTANNFPRTGSTLNACLVHQNKIYTATVGDSTSYLVIYNKDGSIKKFEKLRKISKGSSGLHKPNDETEIRRIRDLGGHASYGMERMDGILNMARAIGDNSIRYLSHEPDIYTAEIIADPSKGEKAILITACDGLTEKGYGYIPFDEDNLFHFLANKNDMSPEQLALALQNQAKHGGSQDNISVIVKEVDTASTFLDYQAVFDGHGPAGVGDQVSELLYQQFHQTLVQQTKLVLSKSTTEKHKKETLPKQMQEPETKTSQPDEKSLSHEAAYLNMIFKLKGYDIDWNDVKETYSETNYFLYFFESSTSTKERRLVTCDIKYRDYSDIVQFAHVLKELGLKFTRDESGSHKYTFKIDIAPVFHRIYTAKYNTVIHNLFMFTCKSLWNKESSKEKQTISESQFITITPQALNDRTNTNLVSVTCNFPNSKEFEKEFQKVFTDAGLPEVEVCKDTQQDKETVTFRLSMAHFVFFSHFAPFAYADSVSTDINNFIFPQKQNGPNLEPILNTMINLQKELIPSSVKKIIQKQIDSFAHHKNGITFNSTVLKEIQTVIALGFVSEKADTQEEGSLPTPPSRGICCP